MGLDATWNLVGIPADARDAARAAALREGLSIGDWLTRRILRSFSELNFHEHEESFDRLSDNLIELSDRLERIENRADAEPMREAVKALHQGLSRLTDDLVKTAGHSAVQISSLSGKLENLNEELAQFRTLDSGISGAFDERVSRVQKGLESLDARQSDASRSLDERQTVLARKLEEAKSRAAGLSSSLEHRIAHLQRGLEGLDARHGDDCRSLAGRLETLSGAVDDVRSDGAGTRSALDQRLALVHQGLEHLNARQEDESRTWTGRLEEVRTESTSRCSALDQRLASVLQRLQGLERLENYLSGSLTGKFDEIRAETSGKFGAFDESLATVRQKLENLDAHGNELSQALTGKLELLTGQVSAVRTESSGAVTALERRVASVHEHLTSVDATQNDTLQILSRDLETFTKKLDDVRSVASGASTALDIRAAQIQQSLDSLDRRQNDRSRALSEMRDREAANLAVVVNLEVSVAELKSQLSDLAPDSRLVALERSVSELASRTETVEHALSALQPKANPVDGMLKSLSGSFEVHTDTPPSEIPRDAIHLDASAESKASQFGEAGAASGDAHNVTDQPELNADANDSQTREMPTVSDDGAQPATLFGLKDGVQGEALTAFAAKMQVSSTPARDPTATLEPVSFPSASLPEPEPEQTHSDTTTPLPPFPDTRTAVSVLDPQAGLPPDRAPAIAAFARSDSESSASGPISYLSAARQSLQAAAVHGEADTGSYSLFGLHFFDAERAHAERKSERTSYALLAAIVLVAILAVAVAAGEWLRHSTPAKGLRIGPAVARLHMKAPAAPHPKARGAAHGVRGQSAAIATSITRPAATNSQKPAMPNDLVRIVALANAGEARAQMILGLHDLDDGKGGNPEEAAKWLERAAEQGEPIAQYRMATMYAAGRGVKADDAKAFHWYEAAAQAGNRKAMSNLAVAYAQGKGVGKNPQEAVRWFSKAAELGLVDAQFDLAILYERGLGVRQSLSNAYRWYVIAARAGDKESRDRIDAIASQLSASDRATGEKSAAEFKSAPMNPEANESK
ncbi:MAG TPA: hypothetical protein VG274_09145 [Rhizomicrobium sp.]|nr:hypothetical protein [Rhizomicrobium sp.]